MTNEITKLTDEVIRLSGLVRTAVDQHKSFLDGSSSAKVLHAPPGCWPARMNAQMAAFYVGERSADAFLRLVGTEYPAAAVDSGTGKGRRRLWLKRDLDVAIGNWVEGEVDPPLIDF